MTFSTRSSLPCALLVAAISGCASSNAARPVETSGPAPSPGPPLAGTTVTADDLDRAGLDPIEKTLASHVPGVWITRTPDGGIAVRIRGQTSINANTEPLYVIDGQTVQPGPGGALGPFISSLSVHPRAGREYVRAAGSAPGRRSGPGARRPAPATSPGRSAGPR